LLHFQIDIDQNNDGGWSIRIFDGIGGRYACGVPSTEADRRSLPDAVADGLREFIELVLPQRVSSIQRAWLNGQWTKIDKLS